MKDGISALMDGELDERAATDALNGLRREREAAEAWRTYHLIGDSMRDTRNLSPGFSARLTQRLAAEPTVLARTRPTLAPRRWLPMAVAASAAVALVGWVAFAPQAPLAPAPVAKVQPAAEAKPVATPIPSAASDYLLAHQAVSPRISLQSMAPYVLTVSEEGARK